MARSKTREQWLNVAADWLSADLAQHGFEVPPVRISIGWPKGSQGKGGVIGQCWASHTVDDGKPAIFISPAVAEPVHVLDILLHELIHAATPGAGHRGAFVKACKAVGLVKPWTETTPSPDLKVKLAKMAKRLGVFDHSKVTDTKVVKQTTRMLKLECSTCGYTVRTTRMWIDIGLPSCPDGDELEPV